MKKHLPSILPALALLTLGGCAASANLATTENDGMYYSSADKVTAVAAPVAQPAPAGSPGDLPNPDYSGSTARSGSSEYYDDDYYAPSPPRYNSYRGGSLGYYSFPYADPFYYGAPIIAYSPYSPFGYSFYDPFYRPYYGYGGLTINIGFGYGFGRPYYRPYGYGGYNPYYGYASYGSPYGPWGGYYGGHYNNGYYGSGSDRPARNVTYGPRRSRTGNGARLDDAAPNGSGNMASPGRSRVVQEGRFATPAATGSAGTPADQYSGRGRVRDVTVGSGNSSVAPAGTTEAGSRTGRYRGTQPMQDAATAGQPEGTSRRWRVLDNSASNTGAPVSNGRMVERSSADQSQPQSGRERRATYYGGDNSGSGTAQPRRQRVSEAAPTRTYSEPTRSYSQPEPTRSYSQPSQPSRSYSEPSRSAPSSSPSSSPSNGGGGGGGRGRVQ